jgi:hypothetical protein
VYNQKDEGNSSFIKGAYRNSDTGDVLIEFESGRKVVYNGIPDSEWAEYTEDGQSRGEYYNAEWKAYAEDYDAYTFNGTLAEAAVPLAWGTFPGEESESATTRLLGTEAPLTAAEVAEFSGFDVTFRSDLGEHTFYTPESDFVGAVTEFAKNVGALGLDVSEVTLVRK